MPDTEAVTFEIDPRSVTGAIAEMNSAVDGYEKGASNANERVRDAFERTSNLLLRMVDKQEESNLRLVRSNEMRAATYGREQTEVQRLIAQRDEYNKRLAGSEEAIRRNTAAFEQMISKAEAGESGGKFREFGESITQFFEQPIAGGKAAVLGLTESLGPMGIAAGVGVGVLVALGTAGFEAAKGVGEASVQTRDLEIRMGVTDKQAAQLGFSARATGADVSVFERAMRGLTTAVEEQSPAANKAREELAKFGVDVEGLKNGSAGTYETLLKISEGLDKLPSPFERNAAGMDLFKRAWFEMAPALLGLRENSEYFEQHGVPFWTDTDAARGEQYLKWATAVEDKWRNIKLHIEDLVARGLFGSPPQPSLMQQETKADRDWEQQQAAREAAARNANQAAPLIRARDQDQSLDDLLREAKKNADQARQVYFADTTSTDVSDILKHRDAWKAAEAAVIGYQDRIEILKAQQEQAAKEPMGPMPSDFWVLQQQLSEANARNVPVLNKAASEWKPESLHPEDEELLKSLRRETEQQTQILENVNKSLKFGSAANLEQQESAIRVRGILGGRDTEFETARELAAVKKAALEDQYRIEMNSLEGLANAEDRRQEIRMQYAKDVGELEMQYAERVAEETKRQLDTIKATATNLWETLLTHPEKFNKQFTATMHQAVIKPVAEGMGNLTAQVLQPVIYGADGRSGLAGVFKGAFGGGAQEQLKVSMDSNTMALWENTAALRTSGTTVFAASGGGIGFGNGRDYSDGGWGTNIFNPDVGGSASGGWGGWGGATSGFSGPTFRTTGTAYGGGATQGILGALFGHGGGSGAGAPTGLGGILGGLKGGLSGLERSIGYTGAQGWTAGVGDSFGTVSSSVLSSPAAGVAGMSLAESGIFGNRRGTWGGVGESAGGGALIGFQYGGPLGAAVGALAGYGIGLGEMAAGDISPEEKVKRDVKAIYGLSVDNQEIKAILAIAQSKYANNIEVTVRSPEVRQMLGLYAAGTGQKMPLSAGVPMAGSLAEQNGKLYQQATYQYGNAYSYASNLPVLGGIQTGSIPSASQPINLSLNVGGDSLNSFMQGNVVTPDVVQDQLATAWAASNGRVPSSASMQGSPNLIT